MIKKIVCLLFVLLITSSVFAVSLGIEPSTFNVNLIGGDSESFVFEVFGVGLSETVSVSLSSSISDGNGLTVEFYPQSFSLKPNERKSVELVVLTDIDVASASYTILVGASSSVFQSDSGGYVGGGRIVVKDSVVVVDENVLPTPTPIPSLTPVQTPVPSLTPQPTPSPISDGGHSPSSTPSPYPSLPVPLVGAGYFDWSYVYLFVLMFCILVLIALFYWKRFSKKPKNKHLVKEESEKESGD